MKVLIAIPCLLRGGTEMQTLALVRVLKYLNYNVNVFCYFEFNEKVVENFVVEGAEVRLLRFCRKSGAIRFVKQLTKEISALKPDIVHVQYMAPGALPILAARLAGVRIVFATVHQPHTKAHGFISKLFLRCAYFLTTRFVAVSQNAEKSWFGSSSILDDSKSLKVQKGHFTIYNTVDARKIDGIIKNIRKEELSKQLGLPSDKVVIGIISRLTHEKGIDIAIDALGLLKSKGVEANMLIIGDGSEMHNLKSKVSSYQLNEAVMFYGMVSWEEAMSYLAVMDVVAVPSRFEGFGLTAAEAMAAGKPVIASGCFGLREIVLDGQTGLLFSPGSPDELADKLERLVLSPMLRKSFGEHGKKRVESLFGSDLFARKIISLYNSYSG